MTGTGQALDRQEDAKVQKMVAARERLPAFKMQVLLLYFSVALSPPAPLSLSNPPSLSLCLSDCLFLSPSLPLPSPCCTPHREP